MFDDQPNWGAGPGLHLQDGHYFEYNFPQPVMVDHIDLQNIHGHGQNYWRGDFTIEYAESSDDEWTVYAQVPDVPAAELQSNYMGGSDGLMVFQNSEPVMAKRILMRGGDPSRGNGDIYRLEELRIYGWNV